MLKKKKTEKRNLGFDINESEEMEVETKNNKNKKGKK